MKKIPEIHYISRDEDAMSHSDQARLMFESGVGCVQIRMKNSTHEAILEEAKKAKSHAEKHNGMLIINDSVDIAKACGAHGIHLGLNDMPADEARKILGDDVIIGGTANTLDDVLMQVERGCDYVGLGPYRFTSTKEKLSPVLGLKGYEQIMRELKLKGVSTPVIAVGGIEVEELNELKSTGLHGIAVSASLYKQYNK